MATHHTSTATGNIGTCIQLGDIDGDVTVGDDRVIIPGRATEESKD